MSCRKYKIGIIGCGRISHKHAKAVESIENVKITSCCDIGENTAIQWAQKYGCESYYTDYVKLIESEDLDGIILATWPNQHLEQIENCIKAGIKNILCEKSLEVTGQKAQQILELAESSGVFIMEGFMYRHHPAITKVSELVDSEKSGKVDSVRACFSDFDSEDADPNDPNRDWRQKKDCAGGIPYDFACYCVNACQYFAAGVPLRVYTRGGISSKYDTINRVYAMIEYDNDVIGFIESSKKCAFNQELQVSTSNKIVNLERSWVIRGDVKIFSRSEDWDRNSMDTYLIPKADAYQFQIENFISVIKKGGKPTVPLVESVVNIYTVEAMVQSLEQNKIVPVSIPTEIVKKLKGLYK